MCCGRHAAEFKLYICVEPSKGVMCNYFVAVLWVISSFKMIVTWGILQDVKIHSKWNSHAIGAHQSFKLCACVKIMRWNNASYFRFSVSVCSSSPIAKLPFAVAICHTKSIDISFRMYFSFSVWTLTHMTVCTIHRFPNVGRGMCVRSQLGSVWASNFAAVLDGSRDLK